MRMEGGPTREARHERNPRRTGPAGPILARRARCSSGGERNLPAMVCAVLRTGQRWRQKLRLRLVRAVHDDGDPRLRRLVRAQYLGCAPRQRTEWRKHAPGETLLGKVLVDRLIAGWRTT